MSAVVLSARTTVGGEIGVTEDRLGSGLNQGPVSWRPTTVK